MASTCISKCVDATAPVRATYVNLYRWPGSDVAFVRSLSLNEGSNGAGGAGSIAHHRQQPKVVDSVSCRQLYLKSYTFSRDDGDDLLNKEMKKRGRLRFRKTVVSRNRKNRKLKGGGGGDVGGRGGSNGGGGRRKRKTCTRFGRAKEMSCVALSSIFRRLLSCTMKVDVIG